MLKGRASIPFIAFGIYRIHLLSQCPCGCFDRAILALCIVLAVSTAACIILGISAHGASLVPSLPYVFRANNTLGNT